MEDWSEDAFAAYVAAMIDGEGCIEKTPNRPPRVSISNTVVGTLRAMQARLGCGTIKACGSPSRRHPARLRVYVLDFGNARDVRRLFNLCGRFIHMKRDQMDLVVSRADAVIARQEATARRQAAIRADLAAGFSRREVQNRNGVSRTLVQLYATGTY